MLDIELDQRSEQELIAHVLYNGQKYQKVAWLEPKDFAYEEHCHIWKAIRNLSKKGKDISFLSVFDELKSSNVSVKSDYLCSLMDSGLCLAGIDYHAKRIRQKSIERRISCGEEITRDLFSELFKTEEVPNYSTAKDMIINELKEIGEGKHLESLGYKTGYEKLDVYIGGFKMGDLIIIAGRPAMGKTTLALNFAINLSDSGVRCLYINLEMSAKQLARKIISHKANINGAAFNRVLDESEMKKSMLLGSKMMETNNNLVILDKGKITLEEIRQAVKKKEFDVVFIDQLTKIKHISRRERLDQEIAEITFELKSIAKEFNVPIVLLHQINREAEKREKKLPLLSDLRDSGAVEQDGDVILFVHRDSYYDAKNDDKTAIIRVAKNKMGRTGDLLYKFEPELSKFSSLDVIS